MPEKLAQVLIIEDSATDAWQLERALGAAGAGTFTLHHATTLEAGLNALKTKEIDVVLLDLGLPDSQGAFTLEAVCAQTTNAAIVVLTGSDDLTVEARALELGVQDYIVKGEPPSILLQRTIRHAIQRKSAEEMRRAMIVAESANSAKNEFLSRMSHELRTPLNAILGFSQLLAMSAHTKDDHDALEHILRAGRHLLKLIDEVLDVVRIDSGNIHAKLEPTAIFEAVNESIDLVRPLAEARSIEIQLLAGADPATKVSADRQHLTQVLLNLLSNAVKYNADGGAIRIIISSRNGLVRVRVADTGPGIPAQLRGRLFTPFDRLGAELSHVEGTGLGLTLSKRLMEEMGGSLGLEDSGGAAAENGASVGSVFWFELPQAVD